MFNKKQFLLLVLMIHQSLIPQDHTEKLKITSSQTAIQKTAPKIDRELKSTLKQFFVTYGIYYLKSSFINLFDTAPTGNAYSFESLCSIAHRHNPLGPTSFFLGLTVMSGIIELQEEIAQEDEASVSYAAHVLGALAAWITPKPRHFVNFYYDIQERNHIRRIRQRAEAARRRYQQPTPRVPVVTPSSQEAECPICYEPLSLHLHTLTEYQHSFHTHCLRNWFATNLFNACPYCRQDIGSLARRLRSESRG